MISRASLFNKGIYKSTLKRNIWGAVLYFIILFLLNSMPLISHIDTPESYMHTPGEPAIYRDSLLQVSIVIGIIVSSVVAMLVYRFIHSKKTSVFIHSLPVSRSANYISTVAAALTLMAAPVIINGIILIILSLTAYSGNFGITHCLVWMGMNLLCHVIMFSIATLASMLTGNTIASVVLTFIIHTAPIIIISCMSNISENFLFGYCANNVFINSVAESNPAVWIVALALQLSYGNADTVSYFAADIPAYLIIAAIAYVLSWFLYKKRGMETAEDVAAFGILNPIYKYFIAFMGTLGVYSMFNSFFYDEPTMFAAIVIILSAVIYFACEMILKKSLRIWNSYKGYLAFALCFGAMLATFAFTSFFGYETRVPTIDNIEKVSIYNYYYSDERPCLDNPRIIELAVNKQKEMLENIPLKADGNYDTRLHIEYTLKNGKIISRTYDTSNQVIYEVLTELYRFDDYVSANEGMFREEELNHIMIHNADEKITDTAKANELLECIRADMLSLEYGEQKIPYTHPTISIEAAFEVNAEKEENKKTTLAEPIDSSHSEKRLRYESVGINFNYKNTLDWLKENGFESLLKVNIGTPVYIADISERNEYMSTISYIEESEDKTIINDKEAAAKISSFIQEARILYDAESSYDYAVVSNGENIVIRLDESTYHKLLDIIK